MTTSVKECLCAITLLTVGVHVWALSASERRSHMSVSGQVFDANGLPVPDALVAVVGYGSVEQSSGITRTDSAGRFTIDGLSEGALYIRAVTTGKEFLESLSTVRAGDTGIKITLRKPGVSSYCPDVVTIAGRVVDTANRPAAGVIITLRPGPPNTFVVSGRDGQFELTQEWTIARMRVPDPNAYIVALHPRRNIGAIAQISEPRRNVIVKLDKGKVLRGFVGDPNGAPIPAAKVEVKLRTRFWSQTVTHPGIVTRKDGRFDVPGIPDGYNYAVSATAGGYGKAELQVSLAEKTRKTDIIGLDPLVLQPAPLSVSGVVLDVGGNPVAGAHVLTYGQGQPEKEATTNGEGRFGIKGLCPGEVWLSITLPVGDLEEQVAVMAGSSDVVVRVSLQEERQGDTETHIHPPEDGGS